MYTHLYINKQRITENCSQLINIDEIMNLENQLAIISKRNDLGKNYKWMLKLVDKKENCNFIAEFRKKVLGEEIWLTLPYSDDQSYQHQWDTLMSSHDIC